MDGYMEDRNYYRFVALAIISYLVMMFITLCLFAYSALAQTTEGLIPNADITEADARPGTTVQMQAVDSVFNGTGEILIPKMDIPVMKGNLPDLYPNDFTLEQLTTLRNAQIKNMIKKGIIKDESQLVRLNRARFNRNEAEVDIYRVTILLHDRAIKEGKDPSYYVNLINSGSPRSAEFVKDAVFCGDSFLLYDDGSNLCSKFPNQMESERHYAASLDWIDYINGQYNASVDTINQLKSENAYLKTKIKHKGKR